MKKQTLKWDALGGNIVQIPQPKVKRIIKPYIQPEWLTNYLLDRDRVIWKMFPKSRKEIEEAHPGINFGYDMEWDEYRYSEIEYFTENIMQLF